MKSLLVFVTLAVSALAAPVPSDPLAVSQSAQGAKAVGAVAAAVNGNANAAVKGVDANVGYNNIGNDILKGANVDVLKRDAATEAAQKSGAAGGLLGAAANLVGNADVTGVDADVECNDIGNDIGEGANVNVLRRDAISEAAQKSGAAGLVAAAVNANANADVKGVDATVKNNNILNNVGKGANVDVLRRDGQSSPVAAAQAGQEASGDGLLAGVGLDGLVNVALKGVDAVVKDNNIGNDILKDSNISILRRTTAVSQSAQKAGAAGLLAGVAPNAHVNAAVTGVDADVEHNNILNGVLEDSNINVANGVLPRDDTTAVAQGHQASGAQGLVAAAANLIANAGVTGADLDISHNNILNGVAKDANVNVLSPLPL